MMTGLYTVHRSSVSKDNENMKLLLTFKTNYAALLRALDHSSSENIVEAIGQLAVLLKDAGNQNGRSILH